MAQTGGDHFSQLKARSGRIDGPETEKDFYEAATASSLMVSSAPGPRPQARFKPETVSREERKIQNVWLSHWNGSEVVRQYEEDWFSHPDLAALYQGYARDHDPVAYMYGLAASQSFRELASKYAREPAMLSLLKDTIMAASLEALGEAVSVLAGNSKLGEFVTDFDRKVRSSNGEKFSPVEQALAAPKAPKEIKLPRQIQFE